MVKTIDETTILMYKEGDRRMAGEKLHVAVAQMIIDDYNQAVNMQRAEVLAAQICEEHPETELILFPELALDGYDIAHIRKFGKEFFTEMKNFWAGMAIKHGCHIIAGLTEYEDGKYYDRAICWDQTGREKAVYRKNHLVPYVETELFTHGSKMVVTTIQDWRVGITICADIGFPEQYRRMAIDGIDLFTVSKVWTASYEYIWMRCAQGRAAENMCYLIAAGRYGPGPYSALAGHSLIVDPRGDIIQMIIDGMGYRYAVLEKAKIAAAKKGVYWLEAFMNRPELYNQPVNHQE